MHFARSTRVLFLALLFRAFPLAAMIRRPSFSRPSFSRLSFSFHPAFAMRRLALVLLIPAVALLTACDAAGPVGLDDGRIPIEQVRSKTAVAQFPSTVQGTWVANTARYGQKVRETLVIGAGQVQIFRKDPHCTMKYTDRLEGRIGETYVLNQNGFAAFATLAVAGGRVTMEVFADEALSEPLPEGGSYIPGSIDRQEASADSCY